MLWQKILAAAQLKRWAAYVQHYTSYLLLSYLSFLIFFMHIILGGNGHVGSAVAKTLLLQGEPVTIVSRSSSDSVTREVVSLESYIAELVHSAV
jgi:hypothetical protein